MWKTKNETAPRGTPGRTTVCGAMAHRRAVGGRKVAGGVLLLLVVAVLLAGSVYVSNRVTGLRAEIASLENQRSILEAGSAQLLLDWNRAAAPAVVTARATAELGLIVPREPDLVLYQVPADADEPGVWRRLLGNMGSSDAQAGELDPHWVMGSMVSLTPRSARAQGQP